MEYTEAEVRALATPDLLCLFNQLTGRQTKKFASRAKGEEQTLRQLRREGLLVDFAEKPIAQRSRGMSFRLAPSLPLKPPRKGSKRARVLELISRPDGALFSEIRELCSWGTKDAYEGVRLLNVFCGYGLWHEAEGEGDYRIWQCDESTFWENVKRANAA